MTNSTFFTIGGRYYAVDMEAFMAFVSKTPAQEKPYTTNINQYYDKGFNENGEPSKKKGEPLEMQTKEVTETKISSNEIFTNVRYDFARSLLTVLLTPNFDGAGELITETTIGQKLAFNTLINEGIIVEITETENE